MSVEIGQVKTCSLCRMDKPLDAYPHNRKGLYGLDARCISCKYAQAKERLKDPENLRRQRAHLRRWHAKNADRLRAYRATPAARESARRTNKKTRAKFPEKVRARQLLKDALRAGRIQRPGQCERCPVTMNLHGHHPDHSKPLDVLWLCVNCHAIEHRRP